MHKPFHFMDILKRWIPVAFVVFMLSCLVYVAVQQSLRQSANDPQVQMAEDAGAAIAGGAKTQSLILAGTVDVEHSLSPYLVFYDDNGTPTGGNGLLNGQYPKLPAGIFDYTRTYGEDRITWQPQANVRDAIVVVRINGDHAGFVMAGRSLREVEWREWQLQLEAGGTLVVTLAGTLILETLGMLL